MEKPSIESFCGSSDHSMRDGILYYFQFFNVENLILIIGITLILIQLIYIIKLKKDNLSLKKEKNILREKKYKFEECLFYSLEYGNELENIIKNLLYDFRKISLFIARKDELLDNDILKLEELSHNVFLLFNSKSEDITNNYKLKSLSLIEKAIYQLLRSYETTRNDAFINSVIVKTKINNDWWHNYKKFTDFYAFKSLSHSLENTEEEINEENKR